MYAVRGSWAGQTLALATSNDSGGKRSRIRRSKEERKNMVESFIKRYQSSNEGNFPSLNLTHKEVGGSFYTVREIVREIIQENKVLGPARFNLEEQNDDTMSMREQYPLGSISGEPRDILFQTENELDFDSNRHRNESLELTLEGNGHYIIHQDLNSVQRSSEAQKDKIGTNYDELAYRKVVNENLVMSNHEEHGNLEASLNSNEQRPDVKEVDNNQSENKIQTNGICEESDYMLVEESPVRDTLEADKEVEFVGACEAEVSFPTEEVEVETFPVTPAIKEAYQFGAKSTELGDLNGTVNNLIKQVQLSNGIPDLDKITSPDCPSAMVTGNGAEGSQFPMSDKNPSMVFPHTEINDTSKGFEVPDLSTIKKDSSILTHNHDDQLASDTDSTLKTTKQSRELDGLKSETAPKGTSYVENSNGTSSKKAGKESNILIENGIDTQRHIKATKGSSPTLNRINLESWAGTSKHEANPLLACLKAVVDAFVKFWSE